MASTKRFFCTQCNNKTYSDYEYCLKCHSRGCVMPVNIEVYMCYLNGRLYGSGNLDYMHELFKDYVVTCEMYGKRECEFKIVRKTLGPEKEEDIDQGGGGDE